MGIDPSVMQQQGGPPQALGMLAQGAPHQKKVKGHATKGHRRGKHGKKGR